ncbi:MAG: ABC transporter permease subunit [Alphaproteobacteria bacterium]|nr:ABC transporter permease subunit [Alphaproteobacteria bacterium]
MTLPAHVLLALGAPGAIVLVGFFLVPLAVVAAEAFGGDGRAFARVLGDPVFWRGLIGSLMLAATAATVSLAVGAAVALHLSRLGERTRLMLQFLIALPLTFSGLIVAYGFILAFGRAGFVTMLLAEVGVDPAAFAGFIYGPAGLAFAYAYYLVPRVVMLLLPVLVNFDQAQIAAAESLGAPRWRALADVLVPQVLPTALSAWCLVAAVAFGAYGTALALVGTQVNILPLLLYSKISEGGSDFPAAAALSLVLMAACTLVMAAAEAFAASRETSGH